MPSPLDAIGSAGQRLADFYSQLPVAARQAIMGGLAGGALGYGAQRLTRGEPDETGKRRSLVSPLTATLLGALGGAGASSGYRLLTTPNSLKAITGKEPTDVISDTLGYGGLAGGAAGTYMGAQRSLANNPGRFGMNRVLPPDAKADTKTDVASILDEHRKTLRRTLSSDVGAAMDGTVESLRARIPTLVGGLQEARRGLSEAWRAGANMPELRAAIGRMGSGLGTAARAPLSALKDVGRGGLDAARAYNDYLTGRGNQADNALRTLKALHGKLPGSDGSVRADIDDLMRKATLNKNTRPLLARGAPLRSALTGGGLGAAAGMMITPAITNLVASNV